MYEEFFKLDTFTKEKYPQSIYHNQKTLKVIGDPKIGRVNASEKVLGKALFANDIQMPEMLYLQFKRSPYSHAKITKIDTTKAKALPGVVMVLTNADIDIVVAPPYAYLLGKEVWLEGDEVAAVAAIDESIAEEAISLIEVTYEQLPFVLYCEDALKPGAYILHGTTNEVQPPATFTHKRGDVATGFTGSDKVLEGKYDSLVKPWTGARDHGTIEAESFTVYWDGQFLNSWTSLKNVFADWKTLASTFKLPLNKVRMPYTQSGCNFGSAKGGYLKGEIMAAYISMKTNRPVKCYAGTEAKFNATGKMADQHHTIKTGVKNDGTLVALSDITVNNTGAFEGTSSGDCHTSNRVMWTVPNLYLEGHDAYTNTQRVTSVRCVHHPHATTQVGIHMDRVAESVAMDPADFLLKNLFTGSGVGTDQDNPTWDVGINGSVQLLQKVIASSGWKSKWKGWKTPMSVTGSKQRGIGIAVHACRHGALSNPMSAHIHGHDDGTFDLNCGTKDIGQGSSITMSLIAAEELGVPAESVRMMPADTNTMQETNGPSGSTVTRGTGTAVIMAARDAKAQIFNLVILNKQLAATKPEEMEIADGYVYLKADTTKKVKMVDVLSRASGTLGAGLVIGRGAYSTKRANYMHRQWSVAAAEVEVDTDTGETKVLNIWHCSDPGRIIWYQGMISQTEGGIIESCGRALFEAGVKDEATGITLNPDYLGYKIPTYADLPNFAALDQVEVIDPYGPFGAKGMAEPLVGAPCPAVLNAIYNACGARVSSTPATPDKILAALGKG